MQDKVAFLMNNLSTDNLSPKAEELGKLLTPEHWPWFVNYMVVRRAAQVLPYIQLHRMLSCMTCFQVLMLTLNSSLQHTYASLCHYQVVVATITRLASIDKLMFHHVTAAQQV